MEIAKLINDFRNMNLVSNCLGFQLVNANSAKSNLKRNKISPLEQMVYHNQVPLFEKSHGRRIILFTVNFFLIISLFCKSIYRLQIFGK